MSMTRLALRNTRRHTRRTLLTALAVALAVATATFFDAYLAGAIDSFLGVALKMETGHVKVMPEEAVRRVRPLPLYKGLSDLDRMLETVEGVEGVAHVAPRLRFGVLLDAEDGAVPALGTAAVAERERDVLELEDKIVQGRMFRDGQPEVVIGRELGQEMGLELGDDFFFVTQTSYGGLGPGAYEVVGLVSTGATMLDRKSFYLPLSEAQYQLAMEDRALEVLVMLDQGREAADEAAKRIQSALNEAGFEGVAAVAWDKQNALYEQFTTMDGWSAFMLILLGIIALTTVINTVLMSVMERVREFGALRALGFSRAMVMRLVMTEAFLIGLLGTAIGLVIGLGLSYYYGQAGIDLSAFVENMDIPINPVIYTVASPMLGVKMGIYGIVVALIAAWYPARVAVRLQPARAIASRRG